MKKRILSILLTLCMMLCLTPISVFAEEVGAWGSAAIKLGAGALNKTVNTEIAPTVYFGQNHDNNPAAWRVIGYDGNGVTSAQGDITLLAAYNMGWSKFGSSAAYADSDLKTAIDALAEKLTSKETDAVQKQTLASGSYNRENTDCVSGTQVNNAVFWPLSTAEASAVNNDLRIADREHQYWASSYWWLRSPGAKNRDVASVDGFANIDHDGIDISNIWGVRPTFKLNLNSVLFASAAVGGKPDGGLTPIPEYSGSEWKLTLLDSSRNFAVTEKAVSAAPDDTVTLNYSGATTGKNEYISVIIADNNGAQYYGRVAQPTAESGTVEIKIPSDIAPGDYTLKVFNEQYNGDYKTDYASNFTDIALTVENQPEQFTLASGGRYYFDLSAMDIPGTVNSNLPDSTLHYVPFTYVGTVDAYSLKNEADKDTTPYEHSLFIADYNVKCSLQRETLAEMNLIYGQTYTASNVNYTLRAPSVGDHHRNEGEGSGLAPIDNEWDTIYQKSADYIKNWYKMRSFGQDIGTGNVEGWYLSRGGHFAAQVTFWARPTLPERDTGFRPVLEVLNPDTLGSDGLKAVTLDLGGGTLGGSSDAIQIIVKNGSTFTAPASDGLTRPDGNTDSYFMWLDGNGNSYEPGGSVPADVTELTVQWTAPTYAVTLNTDGGTINNGNITGYTYGVGATLPAADDMTYTGHTFKGWYDNENLTGSPVTAIGGAETGNKEYWAKWEINQYTITFDTNGGSEIAPITQDYGTEITAPDNPTRKGYTFKGWDKEIPKTMPADNITVKAQWEINQYTITFDTNGGSEIAPITQDYGTEITAPDNPTRKGYTFKGWDKEIPETMPAENITVKAQWEINQYTITFDTNGGSEIAPITQDYGTEITAPDNPTRKGYTFKGWDKEIPETMPAENITVKAQWEINQYTIAFDTNGGSEIAPITQDYGTEITAPDNPTRKGYTFKGWDKEIPETMPAENITVKAQWEINQYTITFDTNGGSEIAPITQDYGTEITAPDNPTRKGYTFKGWDKEIPETMPAENITVKAQWEINQYTITFDTNGGSEIAPITQDYGTEITAPDNPTRKGYTFKGWDKEIPETMPAENITVKAQWEINQYTITFDTNGGSEIAPITQDYGTEITAPDNPTRKGYTFKGWDKEIPETMPAENITITARWKDTEKPTGEIIIGTNKWNEFLNKLTFGIFFKDTQEVTINAVDNSGVVFVSYLVTDKELSEAELNSLVFRAYEEPFSIDPNGEYIVYVMLVDENINITYLRSDRITLDNIQPVISGIENGKTYCEAQTVTVDEKYVDTVTVNGTAVTLDADGVFVLPPTNGEQKIVVTDKAGNNAEMTVTVNNGHTFGEWVSDNNGKHTRKCTVDGCDAFETENCSGGNATCTEKAVCDVCGKAYGEFDGTNHEGGVQEWTTRTAFNHEQKWNCCGAVIVSSEAHEWKDGVCRECGYVCLHNDADKDHVCDYCKKTISEHVDKDKNHICDYCEKTISAHEDATPEEIKKPDTVTAKPDDSKSPQTGDNSNLILWIALLIISGGVMKGVTAFGKSKKHSAKIKDK
ncbi:MAG TPA: InlB B-repeat-containing protein [Ruminococcus bromii]|nr:InlB B-repeat-containing protein [Ruminococcus bromii]HJI86916.1 InlB B-repeat-containing protein [Ruminococcus bromii]